LFCFLEVKNLRFPVDKVAEKAGAIVRKVPFAPLAATFAMLTPTFFFTAVPFLVNVSTFFLTTAPFSMHAPPFLCLVATFLLTALTVIVATPPFLTLAPPVMLLFSKTYGGFALNSPLPEEGCHAEGVTGCFPLPVV
jgi:hypothetical protein